MTPTTPRASTVRQRRAIYRDATAALAADCGPHVTIDAVARAVATSRRQLQRAFEEIGGTTFSEHLATVRMRRAAALLARTSATVADISEAVGYREPSQFRKTFKRRYGVSPAALRRQAGDPLALLGRAFEEEHRGERQRTEHVLRWHDGSHATVRVARWVADPASEELVLLDRVRGPVLDVGCGPGRHVAELDRRGIAALGVDVLPEAVRFARARGARALQQSVFAPLPNAGRWKTALLLDGNVGIGGDPTALLRRIHTLLDDAGIVLLEVEERGVGLRSGTCRLETPTGSSRPFRWGRVGVDAVDGLAAACGFAVDDVWTAGGRWFAQLTVDRPSG